MRYARIVLLGLIISVFLVVSAIAEINGLPDCLDKNRAKTADQIEAQWAGTDCIVVRVDEHGAWIFLIEILPDGKGKPLAVALHNPDTGRLLMFWEMIDGLPTLIYVAPKGDRSA